MPRIRISISTHLVVFIGVLMYVFYVSIFRSENSRVSGFPESVLAIFQYSSSFTYLNNVITYVTMKHVSNVLLKFYCKIMNT